MFWIDFVSYLFSFRFDLFLACSLFIWFVPLFLFDLLFLLLLFYLICSFFVLVWIWLVFCLLFFLAIIGFHQKKSFLALTVINHSALTGKLYFLRQNHESAVTSEQPAKPFKIYPAVQPTRKLNNWDISLRFKLSVRKCISNYPLLGTH